MKKSKSDREKLIRAVVKEGLAIQHRFKPEPLYKTTGRGSFRSETVAEIAEAKKKAKLEAKKTSKPKSGTGS